MERFYPVLFPKGSEMIVAYDEHVLVSTFKFGIIYQRFGQVSILKSKEFNPHDTFF